MKTPRNLWFYIVRFLWRFNGFTTAVEDVLDERLDLGFFERGDSL